MRTRRVVQAVLYAAALFGWHKLLSSTFSVHTKPVHTLPSVTLAREHSGLRPRSETVLRELEQMYLRNEPSHAPIPHPQRPSRGQRRSLALSVDWNATCASVREHTDLEGAVVRDGYGPRGLSLLPDACCTACAQTRGCNVWVACADSSKCGQQCWLKWAEDPATTSIRGSGSFVPWTSGIMAGKDTPGSVIVPPEADLAAVDVVALRTKYGDLRIRLSEALCSSTPFLMLAMRNQLMTRNAKGRRSAFALFTAQRDLLSGSGNTHLKAFNPLGCLCRT